MMTRVEPEGPAVVEEISTPATFPEIADITFCSLPAVSVSLFTEDTAYPKAFASRLMPSAVTTTSSIFTVFSSRTIVSVDLPSTLTSIDFIPM